MPISRSLATDCCVGLVFSSPAALMKGTSVTCMMTHVLRADFEHELPDRLEERQAFDVAGGAADLGDDDVAFRFVRQLAHARLDLVGDVRNDLHGFAEVIAAPLLQITVS